MAVFKAFVPKEVNPAKIKNFRPLTEIRVPSPPITPVEELDPELVGGAITGIGTPTPRPPTLIPSPFGRPEPREFQAPPAPTGFEEIEEIAEFGVGGEQVQKFLSELTTEEIDNVKERLEKSTDPFFAAGGLLHIGDSVAHLAFGNTFESLEPWQQQIAILVGELPIWAAIPGAVPVRIALAAKIALETTKIVRIGLKIGRGALLPVELLEKAVSQVIKQPFKLSAKGARNLKNLSLERIGTEFERGVVGKQKPPIGISPEITFRPNMSNSLVKSTYEKVIGKLPREIVDDLDNIVDVRFGASEGLGGHTEMLQGKNVRIFLERGLSNSDTEKFLRHEMFHAYLIKHPEIKIAREGFFGEENAIRAIEKQIKATGTPTPPKGVAIKGVVARVEDILGIPLRKKGLKEVVTPPPPAVQKITALIKESKPIRAEQKVLRTEELGRRVSEAEKLAEGVPAIERAAVSKVALKGQLPTAEFAPVAEKVTTQEMDDLFRTIWDSDATYFERLNADVALKRVLLEGKLPRDFEERLLARFFGEDLVTALRSLRGRGAKIRETIFDIANIPRAVLASNDMSFPGRQGLLLLIGRPKRSLPAFKPMVKAHFSEKATLEIDSIITSRPNFARAESAGLAKLPVERGAGRPGQREETFISKFAEFIPGVRMSERSFITYGNKVRADIFDDIVTKWERNGVNATIALDKKLANYLNEATGRGSLGKALDNLNDITSALFFSPRLQAARVRVGLNLNPFGGAENRLIAKEASRDIGATIASVSGLVALAGLAGASVETDPRSSNFGKIRVGNTRLDPWGGFQQYARLYAMLISGQRKTAGNKIVQSNRLETLLRFTRTKLAPGSGLITDIWDNQTFIGEELFGEDAPSLVKQTRDRLMSLFIQDMQDSIEQEGFPKGLIGLPAFFGVGAVSFESPQLKPTAPTPFKGQGGVNAREELERLRGRRGAGRTTPSKSGAAKELERLRGLQGGR